MIRLQSSKPSHVVLNVVDLKRSFEFYHEILGLEREEKSDNSVTFAEYGLVIQQASEDAKVPKKPSLRHQVGLSISGFFARTSSRRPRRCALPIYKLSTAPSARVELITFISLIRTGIKSSCIRLRKAKATAFQRSSRVPILPSRKMGCFTSFDGHLPRGR